MKKFFKKIVTVIAAAAAAAVANAFTPSVMGYRLRQGGFVLLQRAYAGYPVGQIVELPASTEAALIASGGAVASAGPATPGNVTTTALSGSVGIAAGASSVVISNPLITVQTQIAAIISQAATDATATSITRVNIAAGQVTIAVNANATAQVNIDWCILNPTGTLSSPT